jgi:hypothetical protein
MGDLYDDSSALVAATHALFAYHYGSLGEIDKASYANSLALRILEHLMRTRPEEKAKDGIHYATLYLHSLMIEIDVTPTMFVHLAISVLLVLLMFFDGAEQDKTNFCFMS